MKCTVGMNVVEDLIQLKTEHYSNFHLYTREEARRLGEALILISDVSESFSEYKKVTK